MILKNLFKNLNKVPETPGVYIFRDHRKTIYIGKAKNLRKRLSSYLKPKTGLKKLLNIAKFLEIEPTDSEIEALFLEADLIKHFKPKFNIKQKSDKSFLCLVIRNDKFPYIEIVREKNLILKPKDLLFGLFANGASLKEALKALRKIFPFRNCQPSIFKKAQQQQKPCLYYHLQLCKAPCINQVSPKEYEQLIKDLKVFLKNKKESLIAQWQKQMKTLAQNKEFEKAAVIRDKIKSLIKLNRFSFIEETPLFSKKKIKIEIYDIAQISGKAKAGAMVVYQGVISSNNEISGQFKKEKFRRFKLTKGKSDLSLLAEMIERRFKHSEWQFPNLILVDGGPSQVRTTWEILKKFNLDLPIVGITKDKRHKPTKPTLPFDRFKWPYLTDLVKKNWLLFIKLNNRSHRFAQGYFKILRQKQLLRKKPEK